MSEQPDSGTLREQIARALDYPHMPRTLEDAVERVMHVLSPLVERLRQAEADLDAWKQLADRRTELLAGAVRVATARARDLDAALRGDLANVELANVDTTPSGAS